MRKPTILIFGIDAILRQNLKKRLSSHGFFVKEAPKRYNVIGLYNSLQPDLIIVCSSGEAPGDKLGIIRKIRRIDKIIPMVLITWFSSESRAIAALRAGVNDYFKVPFSSETLVKRVQFTPSISGKRVLKP